MRPANARRIKAMMNKKMQKNHEKMEKEHGKKKGC